MKSPATDPRTVLILTPSSRLLGARRSLLALAESLDPNRWRPIVCGQSEGQLAEELAQRKIAMKVVRLGWWRKGKYILWRPFAISRLAALARQLRVDLIHCNEIYPNPYAVRAAQSVPGPEGSPCEGQPIPVITHVRLGMKPGMIRKYDLERADQIAVPSEAVGAEFNGWTNRDQRVKVIHNGVNLEQFQRTATPEEVRGLLGIPADAVVLAAIGQLGPRKGGDIILEAFGRLASLHPQLYLMFVGDPHRGQEAFAERLKAKAERTELRGRVRFFPFTTDILPYYEASDINLLVSRQEGFGRTIIEAGAVGIPSIGARVGGIGEIIIDGTTGRLIPAEDPPALAEAIESITADTALRRKMADAAFRHSVHNFSITAHTEKMMDLYDKALEAKSPSL